jgi:hypothetical protein
MPENHAALADTPQGHSALRWAILHIAPLDGVDQGLPPAEFVVLPGYGDAFITDPRVVAAMRSRRPLVIAFADEVDARLVKAHIARCRQAIAQ